MSKTNIGAFYLLLFGVAFLANSYPGKSLLGYLRGIITGLLLCWRLIPSPYDFAQQALLHAKSVSFRFHPLWEWQNWLDNYFWIPVVIVLVNILPILKKFWRQSLLFLVVSIIGCLSVMTGAMLKQANLCLWGPQLALAFLLMAEMKNHILALGRKKIYAASMAALFLLTIFLTILAVRSGINITAWNRSRNQDKYYYPIKSEMLKGWLAYPWEGYPLDKMAAIIRERIPQTESLMNLTDFYIICALTGRPSPLHIPYVFLENQIPAPGAKEIVSERQSWPIRRIGSSFTPNLSLLSSNGLGWTGTSRGFMSRFGIRGNTCYGIRNKFGEQNPQAFFFNFFQQKVFFKGQKSSACFWLG